MNTPPLSFRLLRYFSLTSFLAMALAALLMFFFFREVEQTNLLEFGQRQNVALTHAFSNSLWPTLSSFMREANKEEFKPLPGHPVVSVLNFTVRHLTRDLQVVKIKIYNKRGVTIFSSELAQIGEDQADNRGVRAALAGEVISDLIHRRGFPSYDGVVEDRDMIASYIPLSRGEKKEVEGVFELYYDVTSILERMGTTQMQVVAGVILLFNALYGVLYVIVRRADRIIKEQRSQLECVLKELSEINDTLEERVSDRTERLSESNRALEEEIRERLRAEVELRKLSRAVEQSPVSVLITDIRGQIEYVNPKFCQVTGYEREEVLGKDPSLLKSGRMTADEYQTMWATISSGQEWRGEFLNRKKNGELFWESASISPVRNAMGAVTHYIAVKEDITARKQAEETLRHSEMRLRTIMDNVVEGILTVNEAGIIQSVNQAVETIFGFASAELVGQNVRMLVPSAHRTRHDDYIQNFIAWHIEAARKGAIIPMRGELFFERQIEAERRHGEKFPLELTISHVATDNHLQFIATARDISERKKTEQELEEARRKYFQQEKMAAIGTLSAGIVHEIGNPIAAISGLVEVLQTSCGAMDSDNRQHLEMIAELIGRLADIKRDVSEFAMPQADGFQLLDLNGLIEGTLRLMRFDKRMRHITIRRALDRDLPAVNGIGSQLRQVLINLLINAADALEGVEGRTPEVRVSTRGIDGMAEVVVSDNGAGMDAAALEHALEAFWTTKPVGKGTGLGLSICYSILTEHKGSVELSSTAGEGTAVRLLLPLPEGC